MRVLSRELLEGRGSLFRQLRLLLFYSQARKDEVLTTRVAESFSLPTLNYCKAWEDPKASTLYILAGGASVNRLSASQWSAIGRGVSVGINFWPIHEFCPTFLSTEIDNSSTEPSRATRFLAAQINQNYGENPPQILQLRPNWPPRKEMLYDLPASFQTFLYGRANLVSRNPENLERDLSAVVRGLLRGRMPSMVLPDNGSSVARLIFLGVAQQFQNIVLVGVDQNDGPYFWTEEPISERYAEAAKLFPRSTGTPHSTSSSSDRPHPNETFLPALSRAIADNSETRVFLSSSHSGLYPGIPVHAWEKDSIF